MNKKTNFYPDYTPTILIQGARFNLGQLFTTPGALEALSRPEILTMLRRHVKGDWGDCCPQDWQSNDEALVHGTRLFSVYHNLKGEKIWLITEADRSVTTFLLPSEY